MNATSGLDSTRRGTRPLNDRRRPRLIAAGGVMVDGVTFSPEEIRRTIAGFVSKRRRQRRAAGDGWTLTYLDDTGDTARTTSIAPGA
ncbi:hypothetical protein [Rathayibacter soli]|uniref:hypothetical protein n=1 Tax=Rathayibacter soli TaxID=3144168 RepID=UPI0027E441DE|nr:hypothetical protein [Glaciibacter superstes]